MKKHLFLSVIILLLLSACKKDSQNASSTTAKLNFGSKSSTDVALPTYTVMTLAARKPGENFDTYFAQWNGCGIQVKGPLLWDLVKYPTLVNGVPIVMSDITTYDGTSWVAAVNTGNDGNVFEVTQVYLGGLPSTGFQADYDTYIADWTTYFFNGSIGPAPQLSVVLKTTYSAGGGLTTFTGKLIRITTGSNLAIAPVTYPLPTATPVPPTIPNLGGAVISDPLNVHSTYLLNGVGGNITYANPGTDGVSNGSIKAVAIGSYTNTTGTEIFHYWGTIERPDGTFFSFNVTQNTD